MNAFIRKANLSIIFALLTLSVATSVPIFAFDWKHYAWTGKKLLFILMLGVDLFSLSLFTFLMAALSFTPKWRLADYEKDPMARAEAKVRHDFAYFLLIAGVIIFVLELLLLR